MEELIKRFGVTFDETSKVVSQGESCRTFGKLEGKPVILDIRNIEVHRNPLAASRANRLVSELRFQGRCFQVMAPMKEETREGKEYRV